MPAVSLINRKFREKKVLFLQLLFVILAFTLMVVSSSLFVRNMLKNYLSSDANALLTQTKLRIEAELVESQTTLLIVSNTIRSMILQGQSAETVFRYLRNIHEEMDKKSSGFLFDGFFAYFEAYGGLFFHSGGWVAQENYDPTGRPWYETAVEAGDKMASTPIYFGARTNEYVITFVRRIFSNEGEPLAVMCLNLPIGRIRNYVTNMHITKGGYGVLLNSNMEIVAHPSNEVIGQPANEASPGFSVITHELELGNDLFEREFENYYNQWTVASTMRLDNGWVLTLVTPKAAYYKNLQDMTLIISALGAIFVAALIIFLIRIDLTKSKMDAHNFRQSTLLAEMEKQHEADKRTQLILDATPLGTKLWDRNLNIIECNQEALHLFCLDKKEDFFNRFFELSPEYQPDGRLSKDKAAEFITKAFIEGRCFFEWMHQKLNGEPIPTEITLVRIKHKEDYVVAGYIRDLREYKQMMKNIEQRDSLLNTVNDTAVVLLSTENEDDMMVSIQKGMELLGIAVDLDRVQIWQNIMIDGILYFVHKYEWLSEIGKQKEPVPIGLKIPYKDKPEWESKFLRGEYINGPLRELPLEDQDLLKPYEIKSVVIIPLFLNDRFWGFFSLDDCLKERTFSEEEINILRSGGLLIANAFLRNDMLQNIRSGAALLEDALKEAQEANAAKSKFLATMSHEIRTPMNVILGVTESQISAEINMQNAKEAFEKIFDSGNLLLHIINDILDLSKIEAGKFELNPANYEVLSLIYDATNMNFMQIGNKQIDFKIHVSENIPLHLFGDELRIKQVLNNLLSNAFKYTKAGEVNISFAADNKDANNTELNICVSDTGQGMTEEQVSKLFDEYTRFNYETNRSTTGTGLGMAITRNLVKLMEGTIHVNSTPGKGTAITICLPQGIAGPGMLSREEAENARKFRSSGITEREKHLKIIREPMPYGKVLVVDDMKSNLDVAKLLLNPYQLQIDTAESGFDAIDIINSGKMYDIVFMDHMMPKMDGIETVKRLRQSGYKNTIFALTADAVAGQKEMFLANGFDGFISKPIDIRQLNDSLNKFIRDKEHGRETEKTILPSPSVPEQPDEKEIPELKIPGVDSEKGLALFDGNMDIYISVMRSFVSNALSNMEILGNVSQESLPDYAITVHGMKSISANIGAEELRETALKLELMSKSGDLAGVLSINKAFLANVENVVSGVQAWFAEFDGLNPKPLLPCPDRLLLARLQKSCEEYDMADIDDVMDKLESSNYDTDADLIPWLREKISAMDFSAAATRLSSYQEEST